MMRYVVAFCLFLGLSSTAEENDGKIYIKIGEANVKKSLIAIPPFLLFSTPSISGKYKEVGAELFNTISNDLEVSNLFKIISPEAFLEKDSDVGLTPAPGNPKGFNFESWQKISAEFLVKCGYRIYDGDKMEFEAYVYYVPQAKLVLGKKYAATIKDGRATAHTFADDLLKALTGKPGFFRTKFVVSSDRAGGRFKEIYIMDWDGRNISQVTRHRDLAISPTWHPSGKSIAYTAFAYHPNMKGRNIDLFTYDIYDGKRFLISSRTGINSGSVYSPDGKFIYLTLSKGGDPDIFRMDSEGENLVQLTKSTGGVLNVEPDVSPDGKKLVFSSDRAGNPHIFTMDVDGKNIKRLTFAGKYNSSPTFSPDGTRIAFAGQDKGHFDIFVMDTDGTNMVRLTSAQKSNGTWANNENPRFSPDGRHIVFTSNRTGKHQIYIVSVDGNTERRITVDNYNYFQPRWSPYLQ